MRACVSWDTTSLALSGADQRQVDRTGENITYPPVKCMNPLSLIQSFVVKSCLNCSVAYQFPIEISYEPSTLY